MVERLVDWRGHWLAEWFIGQMAGQKQRYVQSNKDTEARVQQLHVTTQPRKATDAPAQSDLPIKHLD